MKRMPLSALIVAYVLLTAAPAPSSDSLLEQADNAMATEKYTLAIELYEKAEPLTNDPGRVALDLAQAKFRRSLLNNSASDLEEAEQLFRCLLGLKEPRRPLALFGVGNCQMQKAGERDADAALNAIEAYEQCLQAAEDEQLAADARYNLERARLLLNQIRKAEEKRNLSEPESDDGNNPNPKKSLKPKFPEVKPNTNDQKNPGVDKQPVGPPESVKPEKGDKPEMTDEPPPPGAGSLRPVPDKPDLPPLSAKEALEHLKQAHERIWRERHQHRLGLAKPPAADVRDW